ncbi:MAG: hypothetical protein COZ06_36245 [Armatimonadetes bacterium CG_4_10_14_3_um_filter_66_18]|nr:MAG: hypothetical protein AUJ96_17345 [Armatimonadetes bacterium CG2_30_66_41]PIU93801.1 MAG: hypothetical protein COS65_10925 [Armatimonadetes bacterium CG06_land_8_20_14_3_00_66_21]PIX42668.1 MAG: hypothetical protein COZ57_20875 [Armatimonadetes bacterium CG_4_8_14_3_um_filter_66_20]PIY36414.1 MAG: hypothetical protein COZ06_36245 [Armatimonadetes bacterium CG_4_10_14_3_um_filter_66_18]PIZ29810.1 MAG: hypothetical protein COY42_34965 [Armatimonadetes bacterium CG_4_10_14_0_8_um_filter_66_
MGDWKKLAQELAGLEGVETVQRFVDEFAVDIGGQSIGIRVYEGLNGTHNAYGSHSVKTALQADPTRSLRQVTRSSRWSGSTWRTWLGGTPGPPRKSSEPVPAGSETTLFPPEHPHCARGTCHSIVKGEAQQ